MTPLRRPTRILLVTAGLLVAGALFGAVASALSLTVLLAIAGHLPDGFVLTYAAAGGGVMGAAIAPPAAWLLLRRVPLGQAIFWSVAGTVAGAVAGRALMSALQTAGIALFGWRGMPGLVGCALAGFLIAAVVLRLRASRRSPVRVIADDV